MAEDQQIVPYIQQELRDYDDALEPGYRFCPTDSELIIYYLKRKIELGEQSRCRIYDVHVYSHHPNELTGM
ncbi:putative transcription factor NAM family [Helianthus annuus]|nr:putative transcription factor NAM family [Helianthus annuus]KAJ0722280.1 putative transcription factor NAM family [Helianthus annuus]